MWAGGHQGEVEQIKWDPSGQILASSSSDNLVCLWKPERATPVDFLNQFNCPIKTIQWSNGTSQNNTLLAAGGEDGFIALWNINTQQLWNKLHAHDRESGGVGCLAFSPNNKMLASGGINSLVIWSTQDSCQVMRHFTKGNTHGMIGANGTGHLQSNGQGYQPGQTSQLGPKAVISEVNWSHDGMLLAAAIQDYIAVFDIRKMNSPVSTVKQQSTPHQKQALMRGSQPAQ